MTDREREIVEAVVVAVLIEVGEDSFGPGPARSILERFAFALDRLGDSTDLGDLVRRELA